MSGYFITTSVMSLLILMGGASLANAAVEHTDLPPSRTVVRVLEESPVVQAAKSGIALGQANKRRLDAGPYEFSVSTSGQQRKIKEENKNYGEWNIGLDRPLRVLGKGSIDSDIGDAVVKESNFAYEDAFHETARTLLTEWFEWVGAKLEVAQWEQQVQLLDKQRGIVAKREKVGDAAKLEKSMAEAASAQATASLKQAEARVQIAASTLMQNYPGLPLPETATISDPEPVEGSFEEWASKILKRNHKLDVAQTKSVQARLQVNRAKMDLIPDPTIGVYYGSDQGGNENFIGARLSIPLPGSAIRSADSQAAQAQAAVAAQNEALTGRGIMNNIATIYATAASSYSSWESAKIAMASIDENTQKMTRAYELGEVGLTDLLTAQRLKAESVLVSNAAYVRAVESRYRLLLDSHELWLPRGEEGNQVQTRRDPDLGGTILNIDHVTD